MTPLDTHGPGDRWDDWRFHERPLLDCATGYAWVYGPPDPEPEQHDLQDEIRAVLEAGGES